MARSKQSTSKEEFWRALVKEQRRCGLSVRAFCRQKVISESSFYAWRKKLQKRDAQRTAGGSSNGRLIPVDVIGSTCDTATASRDDANAPLEIGTPGGFTLRFGHAANAENHCPLARRHRTSLHERNSVFDLGGGIMLSLATGTPSARRSS